MASFVLAGCADGGSSALERARAAGLSVGFSVEAPYAFVNDDGSVTGEAPEILRDLVEELEIPGVQWYPLDFQELIPALRAGRVDVIAAGMFVTAERAERVRFSHPTLCVAPALVVRASSGEDRNGRQAGCPGCEIAVLSGSVEEVALRHASPHEEVHVVPDPSTGLAMLRSGRTDALAISAPTARRLAAAPDLAVEASLPPALAGRASGCAAFAFRLQDEALAETVDSVLTEYLGSPRHRAVARRFGLQPEELVCHPSSAEGLPELCEPLPPEQGPDTGSVGS